MAEMTERATFVAISTAVAQMLITVAFLGGYWWVMREFMGGRVKVPDGYAEMFAALLGVITGNVGTIVTFWFLRQRQGNPT